jgi:hypothetical protein
MLLAQILFFLLGLLLIGVTLRSALRTLVLPRSAPDAITAVVFRVLRNLFNWRMKWAHSYADRDRIMAYYAPVTVLMLLPTWLALILVGYMGLFWSTGMSGLYQVFVISGSSLFTLGFASDNTTIHMLLSFSEATIGMILVALLIAYLPTMYSAFSRREAAVSQLDVRAGTPPSVVTMVTRFHRIGKLGDLSAFWRDWEMLFAEMEESHTSLPALVFFRSPKPQYSWITAAGCVLDCAAFIRSTVDQPHDPQADLCIRAGFLTMRGICDFFDIPHDADPHHPETPINISRAEFDAVCDELATVGVPLVADRNQAWNDFAGWRVNYDAVLLALCAITMAPEAPWSSDRAAHVALPAILAHKK